MSAFSFTLEGLRRAREAVIEKLGSDTFVIEFKTLREKFDHLHLTEGLETPEALTKLAANDGKSMEVWDSVVLGAVAAELLEPSHLTTKLSH